MDTNGTLPFRVAPHIVEDLGLNLYTDLPRVLVEFVANAYDADSPDCRISIDFARIEAERRAMKAAWDADRAAAKARQAASEAEQLGDGDGQYSGGEDACQVKPLEQRTLPEHVTIVIEDSGHGMSRQDLEQKFLVAGRRRRKEDPDGAYSRYGRVVMGRKGLGKLAGFGVAHRVVIISRAEGESHATKITLDYDDLVRHLSTDEIRVPAEQLDDGGGIQGSGTRIILSQLVHDPLRSRKDTITNEIGDYFALVDAADFVVSVNDETVTPTPRNFVYAYPEPERPVDELVNATFDAPDGTQHQYQYRLRFTEKNLLARQRGVRVYAHRRLAAAPDLLSAPTGMHGFRQTDYLDGVVYADFIDEQPTEYIATDRQSLRWEVPLLEPMHRFLSDEIRRACESYQRHRDQRSEKIAKDDEFTKQLVESHKLPPHKKKIAYAIAGGLVNHLPNGKESPEYQKQLMILVEGLGQGSVLQGMAELAKQDNPEFNRVVAKAVEMTERELSEFMRFVDGRLDAIRALDKIVKAKDFGAKKNEKELHRLFARAPWLIDTTYTQYMTSDQPVHTTFSVLAKELGIAEYAPPPGAEPDDTRPDLVFLLGNEAQKHLVIVELKAPNVPMDHDHLTQLKGYMMKARQFLKNRGRANFQIEGYLIGSMPKDDSRAHKAHLLRDAMEQEMSKAEWEVMDLTQVLDRARRAHDELLAVYERVTGVSAIAEFT